MFGYVVANRPELKMREFYKYKAYYCGLCRSLRETYGFPGQMTLTYDMTFLIVLLTSLYECRCTAEERRCPVHPAKKQKLLRSEITEYAADMNIVLAYHKMADDWKDERKKTGLAGLVLLRKTYRELARKYPEKCRRIQACMRKLAQCEKRQEEQIDITARYFGLLMGELFVYKQDVWEKTLRRMGFYLGKFIYIMDAYDDVDRDREQGSYNALGALRDTPGFDETCREMMNCVLAECAAEFEKLPCIEDAGILRNILYAGVWSRYGKIRQERAKERKGQV